MVAFSGGLDSTVLLHACHRYSSPKSVQAIHVHHGLSSNADAWLRHCMDQCRQLDIPLIAEKVIVQPEGIGIEAAARRARYQVFEMHLPEKGILLQGHHCDDQAETILYRLIQGHGIRGLAGVPPVRGIAQGELLRPLLSFSRKELELIAEYWQLSWIEDESNEDPGYSRNYIRQHVLPVISARWPKASNRISNAGRWCREASEMLEDLARIDLESCGVGDQADRLQMSGLRRLSLPRQFNLLRYWLQCANIDLNENKVYSLVDFIFGKAPEGLFRIDEINGVGIHRGVVCLVKESGKIDDLCQVWRFPDPVRTPLGELIAVSSKVGEQQVLLKPPEAGQKVTIRTRRGGERFHPVGRSGSCTLKKWLNESQVPKWDRDRIPLVFYDEVMVAVGDLVLDSGYASTDKGYRIIWRR